ncbi:MAG TPA: hypothetical protein VII75_16350 [Thermoanaerobaculia bacterium]
MITVFNSVSVEDLFPVNTINVSVPSVATTASLGVYPALTSYGPSTTTGEAVSGVPSGRRRQTDVFCLLVETIAKLFADGPTFMSCPRGKLNVTLGPDNRPLRSSGCARSVASSIRATARADCAFDANAPWWLTTSLLDPSTIAPRRETCAVHMPVEVDQEIR